ncbi:hypothetical protein F0145_11410 [Adhaeribacter rhizoryzae]|uniref:Beta-lactamase-inhibitor-like PepSY-like domain-containing protein n=2 Tax=Adhaeribacter rhizoryzae TaxID=2607907 RepID=A0A5M6DJS3_9BACT|nr:hypothetical protein F0145_11410 [Adhaeribacter rhizoryzae]
MKNILCSALLMMVISLSAFANNGTDNGKEKVSGYTKSTFNTHFAGAENVTWSASSRFQKATFTKNGKTMTAFYDAQNELVGTTQLVEITALSPKAIKNLVKKYPNYQMGEIIKYTGNEEVYYVNLKNETTNFLVEITPDMDVRYFKTLK